jgi:hypothetical protein
VEDFELKTITYQECVGYFLLAKVYYIEEKLKDAKVPAPRLVKQRKELLEKVKIGLRNFDELQAQYERYGKEKERERER